MVKVTIKDIKERYLASKEKEKRFKWTYYVRRPVSYYVAWPFLKLGVSATSVTILWLFIAVIGCAIIASGGYLNMIIGTAILEFAVILDCVDGHIARLTRPTHIGDVLDTWVSEILLVASIFSVGIGLSNSHDLFLDRVMPSAINNTTFIYLGFFGALAALSSWTVRLHWRTITLKLSLTDMEFDLHNSKKTLIVDNLFHYSGAVTMLLTVSAILYILDVTLIVVSITYGFYLFTVAYGILRKARLMDSRYLGRT